MAIERGARVALSIAFAGSLAAYPALPPEIPSRDAPLIAFLLPSTAIAIGWIQSRVGRRAPGPPRRSLNAAAATALFLSGLHALILIGLIGGYAWLGRAVGVLVGLYLIVTGNDLPRVRRPIPGPGDAAWRRGQRLGGYVRVTMGGAVCAAGLLGTPEFSQFLIVLAVGVELVARAGAVLIPSAQES